MHSKRMAWLVCQPIFPNDDCRQKFLRPQQLEKCSILPIIRSMNIYSCASRIMRIWLWIHKQEWEFQKSFYCYVVSTLFFYTYDIVWPDLKSKQTPQLRVKLPKSNIVCQATTKNVCCFRQKFIERDDHCMSALNRCFKSNSS